MDNQTWNIFVHTLVCGALRGMKQASDDLNEASPGTYPLVDDSDMFDVATLLAATLIEASPQYQDEKRFGKAADMARNLIAQRVHDLRRQSDSLGTKMLYRHMEAALGLRSDAGLIN